MAIALTALAVRRWRDLVTLPGTAGGAKDAGATEPAAGLDASLARVATTGTELADAERANELARLDLARLTRGLGRPPRSRGEPSGYALVLAASGTMVGLAAARAVA